MKWAYRIEVHTNNGRNVGFLPGGDGDEQITRQ